MNKKKLYKTIIILIAISIISLIMSNAVFAKINTNVSIGTKLRNEAATVGNRVVGAIRVIGVFVSVAMTMVIGIKYMVCSVEEKAEYKKTAIAYLIGAILIFATTQFINFIYDIMN